MKKNVIIQNELHNGIMYANGKRMKSLMDFRILRL